MPQTEHTIHHKFAHFIDHPSYGSFKTISFKKLPPGEYNQTSISKHKWILRNHLPADAPISAVINAKLKLNQNYKCVEIRDDNYI